MPPENNTQPPPPIPPPSTELLALARLRQKAIAHPLQQCQLTLYVPPDRIGAIIGRGGRTILSIQQEAKRRSLGHDIGVRIHVAGGTTAAAAAAAGSAASNQHQHDTNSNNDGGGTWNYNEYQQLQQQQQQQQDELDDEWVPVIIRADPIGCLEACRLIVPLVDPRSTLSSYLTIVFDVPIARAKHNLLVGKGGIVLAGLSATYETRIMIPPNELMSNVESTGNIWEQRQQQQQQQQVVNTSGGDDVGSAMLFDVGGSSMSPQQMNAGPPTSNIIQLEGEINNLENLEKCLVRMLGIVAAEESMRFVPTGIIVDIDSDAITTTPTKKTRGGTDSNKASPSEKAVAIIVANSSIPSKIWRSIQRKTNTKIQRKNIREEDPVAGDEDVVEPSLVNENEGMGGEDDDDEGVNKEVVTTDAARPHSKFIITGREQSVQKAAAQIEKILGLEVVTTEITVRDALPTTKGGDDQADDEVAPNGEKSRNRRGKKKAAITQPE